MKDLEKTEARKKAEQEAKQYWEDVQKRAAEIRKAERAQKIRRRLRKLNGVNNMRTQKLLQNKINTLG